MEFMLPGLTLSLGHVKSMQRVNPEVVVLDQTHIALVGLYFVLFLFLFLFLFASN